MNFLRILILLLFVQFKANALIEVDITRGNLNPLPIAVSPLSSNEVTNSSGAAYSAGGKALTSPTVTLSGTTAFVDFADVSWTSASFTANGALIYRQDGGAPTDDAVVQSQSDLLIKEIVKTREEIRVLFSAHGLPKKIIEKGDPYQLQVEKTAEAIAKKTKLDNDSWNICYQSRVGPLEWIGPSLDDQLKRASIDKIGVIVLPIAFSTALATAAGAETKGGSPTPRTP